MSTATLSLSRDRVCELTHAAATAGDDSSFTRVGAIDSATPATVVFAQDAPALARALASPAGLILAQAGLQTEANAADARLLWVRDARLAFSLVAVALRPRQTGSEIHPTAVIASSAILGQRVSIGPGVILGEGVRIGDDTRLDARVVIYTGTTLGARVEVHAGTVLGGAGFGWARDRDTGEYVQFPQQGRLLIEDDVSIGANCTIDRGALDSTVISAGTKIDNLVHIAHSCRIGRRVVIAAQTGIAGSSRIGDDAVIAGQVGIADHVEIGEGVVLGAKCGVPSHKIVRGAGQVFWGIPARPIGQYLRELARLRRGL